MAQIKAVCGVSSRRKQLRRQFRDSPKGSPRGLVPTWFQLSSHPANVGGRLSNLDPDRPLLLFAVVLRIFSSMDLFHHSRHLLDLAKIVHNISYICLKLSHFEWPSRSALTLCRSSQRSPHILSTDHPPPLVCSKRVIGCRVLRCAPDVHDDCTEADLVKSPTPEANTLGPFPSLDFLPSALPS